MKKIFVIVLLIGFGVYFCFYKGDLIAGILLFILASLLYLISIAQGFFEKIGKKLDEGLKEDTDENEGIIPLLKRIEHNTGYKGPIWKQLTQRRAKKEAEEILAKIREHKTVVKNTVGKYFLLDDVIRHYWNQGKDQHGLFLRRDWWDEVEDLEFELEDIKWNEKCLEFEKKILPYVEKDNKIRIHWEKERGENQDQYIISCGQSTIRAEGFFSEHKFRDLLQLMGCPKDDELFGKAAGAEIHSWNFWDYFKNDSGNIEWEVKIMKEFDRLFNRTKENMTKREIADEVESINEELKQLEQMEKNEPNLERTSQILERKKYLTVVPIV